MGERLYCSSPAKECYRHRIRVLPWVAFSGPRFSCSTKAFFPRIPQVILLTTEVGNFLL